MPREPKTLFCCGEMHKSGYVHRLKVHQQYTRINFNDYPDASFTVQRNSQTKMFHCPECDHTTPMPIAIRQHIFYQCEAYSKYRSALVIKLMAKSAKKVTADTPGSTSQTIPVAEAPIAPKAIVASADEKAQQQNVAAKGALEVTDKAARNLNGSNEVPVGINSKVQQPSPATPSIKGRNLDPRQAVILDASNVSGDSLSSTEAGLYTPVLRPATWTPINSSGGPLIRSPVLTSTPGLTSRSISSLSSRPTRLSYLTGSSIPMLRSPILPVKTEFGYPWDSPSLGNTPSMVSDRIGHAPTAARIFLDSLRRPLGRMAPHMHSMGVVTEADLDLVCTMPGAWDELGALLRTKGVSLLEWLMVKDALKARARAFGVA